MSAIPSGGTPSRPSEHVGRVAVVTGGSGAIGRGIAARLAAEGAIVHALDVTAPPPSSDASSVTHHRVDVASSDEVTAAISAIEQRHGAVSYLISAAAIFPSRPFLEVTPDEWQRTLAVNATGAWNACRAVLSGMVAARSGSIVLVASMLARTGGTNCAPYATSKGALLGLARSLALEVAADGVRVNVLTPGLSDTPQPRGHLSDEQLAAKGRATPLGRLGTVEDMVEACLFLLSSDTSFYTGQELRVNGGSTLW